MDDTAQSTKTKKQVRLHHLKKAKTGVMQQSEAATAVNRPATQPLLFFVVVVILLQILLINNFKNG